MAVSGQPNAVYVMKALMADLERINRANGYMTDVRTVKMPDYAPDDNDFKTMLAEETPALLVWVSNEDDPTGRANSAQDRPHLHIQVTGIVKQGKGTQWAMLGLASDVRRIMRQNPTRDHPEYTGTNSWGVDTSPSGGRTFAFAYPKLGESTLGVFDSFWSFEYQFPRATG